jgi:PAS domain S-box-containing protein
MEEKSRRPERSDDDSRPNGHDDRSAATSSSWTDILPKSAHVDFFKQTDWASTPLGPLDTWGSQLRFVATMCFNDSRGAAVYWGPEMIGMYNENFIVVAGKAHPILMGNSFKVGFPSAWDDMKHLFHQVFQGGACVDFDRIELLVPRENDYVEEAYFMGQFIPLKGENGQVKGAYNSGYESTAQVLYERRRAQLNKIAAISNIKLPDLFHDLREVLESNAKDVSMALIYSVDEETTPGKCLLRLECSVGVPSTHPSVPVTGVLGESQQGFLPLFKEVRETMTTLVLCESTNTLEPRVGHLLNGIQWRGWGDRCRDLSFVPLQNASQLIGFMVLATNPRRTYDETCAQFVTDVSQQIAMKWSTAITADNTLKREQRLMNELAVTEQRIRHMAKHAPVGMVHITPDGTVQWANEQWYELTGSSRDKSAPKAWLSAYTESSQQEADRHWQLLLESSHTTCDLQLNRRFLPPVPDDVEHSVWVTAQGFPLMEDGKVKYIMGTLTNVSHLKWAESVQARSAQQASDAKRQQEEFIDMTSHEMRNPLSAMYQCAAMISTSMEGIGSDLDRLLDTLAANVDAAKTILVCAAHQKRIIDDVLILNRLEHMKLSITPVPVRIPELISNITKVFQLELATDNTTLIVVRDPSFEEHSSKFFECDPSRLTQVFMNLISNAIKFTRGRRLRNIIIRYGAGLEPPDEKTASMTGDYLQWSPITKRHRDLTLDEDWGHGTPIYLRFSLQDTGPGMDADELQRMFSRFSQANAKTHITYGGAGLGLYISRELTEMQSGRMGVTSTPDVGTTIAFYIKSRETMSKAEARRNSTVVSMPVDPIPPASDPIVVAVRGNAVIKTELTATILPPTNTSKPAISALPKQRPTLHCDISFLLVEDNLVNQTILRKQLQRLGCTVHVANHGVEALNFLHTTSAWSSFTTTNNHTSTPAPRVDVVLMDWEMPVMDGLTCTKRIRAVEEEGRMERLPIIGITANARNEQIQRALAAGIDDVISKPFLVPQLMEKVRRWVPVG